jgi:hypothetical protein
MVTMKSLLACIIASLALTACPSNALKDAALKRATQAHRNGDLAGEALALREACAAEPSDKDVCRRSTESSANALNSLKVTARTQCELASTARENMDACVQAIAQARQLASADPEVELIADNAGRSQAEFCNSLVTATPPPAPDAVRLARCATARQTQIATPTFTQWVIRSRQVAATAIEQLTTQPGFAGNAGATAVLLSTAACLLPSDDLRTRANRAQAVYAGQMRPQLTLAGSGPIALDDICAASSELLGGPNGRVACRNSSKLAPQLRYELVTNVSAVDHRVTERPMSQQYVARIDRRENPEYPAAVQRESSAREQVRRAEDDLRSKESLCSTMESALSRANSCYSCKERTDKDTYCGVADASRRSLDDRKKDARDAQDKLRDTPTTVEEKIFATARWTVRTHRWTASWQSQLATPAATSANWTGTAEYQDTEHEAVPQVNVAYDALTRPENGWQLVDVRSQIAKGLAAVVTSAIAAEGQRQRGKCSGAAQWEGGWLSCWAASSWWMGGQFDGASFLQAASAGDADPRVRGMPVPACL